MGSLDKQFEGKPPLKVTPAMNLGRDLHEAISEPWKLPKDKLHLKEHERVLAVTQCPRWQALYKIGKPEFEAFKTMEISNPLGFDKVKIKVKAKADHYIKSLSKILDYKFMSAKVMHPIDTVLWLNYDRQAAWYMDIFRVNEFTFMFVNTHDYVPFTIRRGDNMYLSGKAKYMESAWRASFLKPEIVK